MEIFIRTGNVDENYVVGKNRMLGRNNDKIFQLFKKMRARENATIEILKN